MSRSTAGFTLAETLVAFVVLALVSAAVYRGFIDAGVTSARTRASYEAHEAGLSLLNELTARYRPDDMPRAGIYGGHWHWTLDVERRYLDNVTIYREVGGLFDLRLSIGTRGQAPEILETTVLRSMR